MKAKHIIAAVILCAIGFAPFAMGEAWLQFARGHMGAVVLFPAAYAAAVACFWFWVMGASE